MIYIYYNTETGRILQYCFELFEAEDGCAFLPVTSDFHKVMIGENYRSNYSINTSLVNENTVVSDDSIFIEDIQDEIFELNKDQLFEAIKNRNISEFKEVQKEYLDAPLFITYADNESGAYTFTLEEQIKLQGILISYKAGDSVYYEGKTYTYEQIRKIYNELFNNVLFHQIYLDALIEYVSMPENREILESKTEVVIYGTNNDFIAERMEVYESQKLS